MIPGFLNYFRILICHLVIVFTFLLLVAIIQTIYETKPLYECNQMKKTTIVFQRITKHSFYLMTDMLLLTTCNR